MLTMNAQQLRDMFLFVAHRLVDSEDLFQQILPHTATAGDFPHTQGIQCPLGAA